jgi:dihydroorotase
MNKLILRNVSIINEGAIQKTDILIEGEFIKKIGSIDEENIRDSQEFNFEGKLLLPGLIDDQVHFREPGLTTKGSIESESKAALAGGVTSYMEMPNTNPQTSSLENLQKKFEIAEKDSWVNYSFYFGATNSNSELIRNLDINSCCGIKVFMGSSTGDMLVDDINVLKSIFEKSSIPIAIHSEDEEIIKRNLDIFKSKYGDNAPANIHPELRSREACIESTKKALQIAEKGGGHIHILHLSTAEEVELIQKAKSRGVHVTAEVCVHHLLFNETHYDLKGNFIKWNPSIKKETDRLALINGLKENVIDVIATDHAPHELEKKSSPYFNAPSGGPMVQHSLIVMLEMVREIRFSVTNL